jgi:hypothetical protein
MTNKKRVGAREGGAALQATAMAALVVLPAMPSSSSSLPFFFHVPNQGPDIFET